MIKSKLIQYLSLFTTADLRNFRAFVHSPYFNKHQKTKELIDYIMKVNNFESGQLGMSKVFKKIFPLQAYEEQKLRTVMSYLVQLIYRYYAQQAYEQNQETHKIMLLEKALQEGQIKMFKQHSLQLEKSLLQKDKRDSNTFLQVSKFQRLQDNFDINYGHRSSGIFLDKALSNFDSYYLCEKLRMTCEMLARKQVTGQEYSFPLLPEIINYIEIKKEHFEMVSEVWIYYLIFKMMSSGGDLFYFELKKRLERDTSFFKHQDGRDFYTHALNYCIHKLNFGELSFKKETFELYQQMLKFGLLHVDNVLPQWDYTNIVKLGCDLQESKWTKNFIYEQKIFLNKSERENTFTYNLAAYHYAQKEYTKALELLNKVEFTEVYNNLLTRILMLKIYFETKDWSALEYFLDAFRLYLLRSKKLEEARRGSVLKLIRYTRSLFRLKEKQSVFSKEIFAKKLDKLKMKINTDDKVLNKKWLLDVIDS